MRGRSVESSRTPYRLAAAAAGLLILALSAAQIAGAGGTDWGFSTHAQAGRRVAGGQVEDLYQPALAVASDALDARLRFRGLPGTAWLYGPLAAVSPNAGRLLFGIASTVMLLAGLWLLYRWHRPLAAGPDDGADARYAARFWTAALLWQPLWATQAVGGHSLAFVFCLLAAGLILYANGRSGAAAVATAAAVALQPTLLLAAGLVGAMAFGAFSAHLLLALTGAGLLSLVVAGVPVHQEFGAAISAAVGQPVPWFFNSSIYAPIQSLQVSWPLAAQAPWGAVLEIFQIVLHLAVLAGAVLLLQRSRARIWPPTARRHFLFTIGLVFWGLLLPTLWDVDLSLLFVPIAYLLAVWDELPGATRRLVGLTALTAVGQNLVVIEALQSLVSEPSGVRLVVVSLAKSSPVLLLAALFWGHQTAVLDSYEADAWMASAAGPPAAPAGGDGEPQ